MDTIAVLSLAFPERLPKQSHDPSPNCVPRSSYSRNTRRFTGTTKPGKEVTLRARIEGQLVSLNIDRGDRVNRGQVVGQQDDVVLTANVLQAEGELARTQTLVANAQAQVERAQAEYAQAQADSRRLEQLATVGVVPSQQAEQARTRTKTALQTPPKNG